MRDINIHSLIIIFILYFLLSSCITNVCYNKNYKNLNTTLIIQILESKTASPIPNAQVMLKREKWPVLSMREYILYAEKLTNDQGEVQFRINNQTNYEAYASHIASGSTGSADFRFKDKGNAKKETDSLIVNPKYVIYKFGQKKDTIIKVTMSIE